MKLGPKLPSAILGNALVLLLSLPSCKPAAEPPRQSAPSPLAIEKEEPRRPTRSRRPSPALPADDGEVEVLALDQVPAFLLDDAPPEDDSLEALMKKVRIGGDESEGSFASIESHPIDDEEPWQEEEAIVLEVDLEDGEQDGPGEETELPLEDPAPDPCAALEAAIVERQDYLRRVAAERDSFAWVEDSEDAQALRLIQGLRRCEERPGDPDCKPPPIEVRLEELEPPRHQYERWPTDLVAEGKDPNEIPHDPQVLDLLHRLAACRKQESPQPLLR